MKTPTIIALRFLVTLTILTGVFYPLLMTGLAQLIFPFKANGSLIMMGDSIKGSVLIGQKFDSSIYFWSRPSATGYNPIPSGASNFGPTSVKLKKQVEERRHLFAEANALRDTLSIPKEMIFASGSGLDPDISPESALMQVERVARARQLDNNQKEEIMKQIKDMTLPPQFMFFGEPRINVLLLNMELDKIENKLPDIK